MKKIILAFLVLTIASFSVNAQEKAMKSSKPLHLSFGLDGGAPLGKYANRSAFIIGGDLQLQYNVSDNFGVTASAGIDARLNKGGVVNTIYSAPLLAGLRFYFTNKFYISEQTGYSISLSKGWSGVFTNVAGVGFKLSPTSDVLLGYKGLFYKDAEVDKLNIFALRLAYAFGK
jgi:hypothetical protein